MHWVLADFHVVCGSQNRSTTDGWVSELRSRGSNDVLLHEERLYDGIGRNGSQRACHSCCFLSLYHTNLNWPSFTFILQCSYLLNLSREKCKQPHTLLTCISFSCGWSIEKKFTILFLQALLFLLSPHGDD